MEWLSAIGEIGIQVWESIFKKQTKTEATYSETGAICVEYANRIYDELPVRKEQDVIRCGVRSLRY